MEGCGPERISQIVDAIDQMDSLSEDAEILQTMLFSAQEMKIDADGRMLLPAEFIEFAALDGTALFSGIGRSFQIWRPDQHQKRETDFRDRAAKQGVPRLTLGRRRSRRAVMSESSLHIPVMLDEVIAALTPSAGQIFLDATFGNGGYTKALLDTADCQVAAIDRDPDAILRGQPLIEPTPDACNC